MIIIITEERKGWFEMTQERGGFWKNLGEAQ